MIRRRPLLVAALAAPALPARAQAQGQGQPPWPTRPVTFVNGFAPGSTVDVDARTMGREIETRRGQPVVIESRPGASGNLAAQAMLRAPADGFTIGLAPITLGTNPWLMNVGYDPQRDIPVVARMTAVPVVIPVASSTGFRTLADLVAFARQAPERLRLGHGGVGASGFLAAHLFARVAGFQPLMVPFSGTAPVYQAMLAGTLQGTFTPVDNVLPGQVAAGAMRVLAVIQETRIAMFPDVPTTREQGYGPEVDFRSWHGVMVRSGTPAPIATRLFEVTVAAARTPAVQEALLRAGRRARAVRQHRGRAGLLPRRARALGRADPRPWYPPAVTGTGRMQRRTLVALAAATLAAWDASAQPAWAPSRPIRMVVPFPPGGVSDLMARLVAAYIERELGQPVVVEPRPGAGGNLALDVTAKAAPDGHTIGVGTVSGLAINRHLYPRLPFDPDRDLAPLSLFAINPNMVLVHPSVPARTMPELVAWLRANPGTAFASGGVGTSQHLAGELLARAAGIRLTHVPYRGTAGAIADVQAGRVPMMVDVVVTGLQFAREGTLRGIAVTTPARLPQAPDLPTVAETFPGFEATSWLGFVAPAQVPGPVLDRLSAVIAASARDPDIAQRVSAGGAVPQGSDRAAFAAFIRAEAERWGAAVRASGATAD
jgi:tripartite-type tricarboxylate transporter receptor subunit TctC